MENLPFTHKLFISVCWGLLLMYTAAEEQYFIVSRNASWEGARNHCQVCFKEMVTLTPKNVHIVAKMINSDHWIGLRKYINYNGTYNNTYNSTYNYKDESYLDPDNSTNTSSKVYETQWTRWANGDPLVFQNWYPGYPVFKSPLPKIDCCSCSCTCPVPIVTTTNPPPLRTTSTTTGPPTHSAVTGPAYRSSIEPNVTENGYESFTNFTDVGIFKNITEMMNTTSQTKNTQTWKSSTLVEVHTTDSPWTTTPQMPIVSTCERSPMLPPIIPENNKDYIENSCVVILSSGPWIERVCVDELPFICYEERFMGQINRSNVTSSSGFLRWEEGPGDISYYRLQATSLQDNWNLTLKLSSLNFTLDKLTPGTGYNIQVFPVKCGRDLNPQNLTFYTIPGEVRNLTVTGFTETSVNMSWKKPEGNYGFFRVTAVSQLLNVGPVTTNLTNEFLEFKGLEQGNQYTFIFITGVNDLKMWSENVSISNCTRPGKVSSLQAGDNKDTYLTLTWSQPKGAYQDFSVRTFDGNGAVLNATVKNQTDINANPYKVYVSGLPMGKMIKFSVTVWSSCSLEGDNETVTTYTAPGSITNLTLNPTENTIKACWDFPPEHGNVSLYTIELFLGGICVSTKENVPNKNVTFENLKSTSQYTVKVYAVLNKLKSPGVEMNTFTKPTRPTNAKLFDSSTNYLVFTWNPPVNSSATNYNCTLKSAFWSYSLSQPVYNVTTYNFTGLKSGSTYQFQVSTMGQNETSDPTEPINGNTVNDEVEINLSMLCSSATPLYCDQYATRVIVLNKLKDYYKDKLDGNVFYAVDDNSIVKQ